jgi:AcrR family transcriptional regulator
MTAPARPDQAARGPGRPARINRQMIAEAAHRVGLEGLTLKAVADELGVSIAALYHHVDGKDSLLRLAAELSSSRYPFPVDRGQHWAVWLYEWSRYAHDAFVDEPETLKQYLDGNISPEMIANRIDLVIGVLVRQGFALEEAFESYEAVSAIGIGMAVTDIRTGAQDGLGQREVSRLRTVLDNHGEGELPHLRAYLATHSGPPRSRFDQQVQNVLRGIAARRGDPWEPIEAALRGEPPAPRRRLRRR